MASGILCQSCGIEAPTKYVEFHQNIGMLVARRRAWFKGSLCKRCLNKKFWSMTGTTLFLGPWGYISLFIAPIMIINNVVRYLGALGLSAVPADAKVPVVTEADAAKLKPFAKSLVERLNAKEPLADVARDIAPKASVTPGQVVKYVVLLSKPKLSPPPTFGFPVQPPQAAQPAEPVQPLPPILLEGKAETETADVFGMVDDEQPSQGMPAN